jgi:hypothetical protein
MGDLLRRSRARVYSSDCVRSDFGSVGVDAETRRAFYAQLDALRNEYEVRSKVLDEESYDHGAVVGFIVGLTAQQLARERKG